MYCIECGKQIPDNSNFCAECGGSQNEASVTKKSFFNQLSQKTKAIYFCWVLIHLSILLVYAERTLPYYGSNRAFWPITGYGTDISTYDIREFAFYTIIPLVVLYIINLLKKGVK